VGQALVHLVMVQLAGAIAVEVLKARAHVGQKGVQGAKLLKRNRTAVVWVVQPASGPTVTTTTSTASLYLCLPLLLSSKKIRVLRRRNIGMERSTVLSTRDFKLPRVTQKTYWEVEYTRLVWLPWREGTTDRGGGGEGYLIICPMTAKEKLSPLGASAFWSSVEVIFPLPSTSTALNHCTETHIDTRLQ
jgi:hypothetical protein